MSTNQPPNQNSVKEFETQEPAQLAMMFDPNTIQHLGVRMYSTLPPVIAEILSNSYDAEATEVDIHLRDKGISKEIEIKDNGHGMSYADINHKFLRIGRNRRRNDASQKSKNGIRQVIGKKGIGKLSFFGIAPQILVETICDGKKNVFKLDWEDLTKGSNPEGNYGNQRFSYKPQEIEKNTSVQEANGTTIKLLKVKRKTPFSPKDIAYSLAKSFQVFDEENFLTRIYHNDDSVPTVVKNDLRYSRLKKIHEWDFPFAPSKAENNLLSTYEFRDKIKGKVILTGSDTVPSDMRGIALFSRKKLVNRYEYYDNVASNHGYNYLTGWLDVDFIDEFDDDLISTNRTSLNWVTDDTRKLREYLHLVVRHIYNQSREIKKKKKVEAFEMETGEEIDQWIRNLPRHEAKIATKIVDSIINGEGISVDSSREMVKYVKDSFQFEAFKNLAREIDEASDGDDKLHTSKIIELVKEWKLIEAREFHKIAIVRIETIQKFREHIKSNSREVPELHNFLKEFPWILDPRIMNFQDEVTYSRLLREKYPNDSLDESNKRIDFLCVTFPSNLFIIELKRPGSKIGKAAIDQTLDYITFLETRIGTEDSKSVVGFIVGGELAQDRISKKMIDTYSNDKLIFVKTYEELLTQAENYHKEFVEKYEHMRSGDHGLRAS